MNVQTQVNDHLQVSEDVLARRMRENAKRIRFPAFCRIEAVDEKGTTHVFWLVERTTGNLRVQRSWTGTALGATTDGQALGEGIEVSKNAPFGVLLDSLSEQPGALLPLNTAQERAFGSLQIVATAFYRPVQDDAQDGAILLQEIEGLNFESLRLLVQELRGAEDEIEELRRQQLIAEDTDHILEQLREKEAAAKKLLERKKQRIRHIIAEATLRNQPKLDAEQVRVKQLQLLRGGLIIDGGPGTGKTTTLIDRINFLTDAAIREHGVDVTDEEFERLTNPDTGYLLFTPNELLMHYLRDAMNAKGLIADRRMVKTWADFREVLALRFGFLTADAASSPFLRDRRAFRKNVHVFDLDRPNMASFAGTIQDKFVEALGEPHLRLLNVDADQTADPATFRTIVDAVIEAIENPSLEGWIKLFHLLYDRYRDKVSEAGTQSQDQLRRITARIQAKLRADAQLLEQVRGMLFQDTPEEPEEELEEEAEETEDQEDVVTTDGREAPSEEERIYRVLRTMVRKLALRKGDKSVRLTKRERDLRQLLDGLIDEEAIDKLAPILLYAERLRPAVAGPERNVLNQIRRFYKDLRRRHLDALEPYLHTSGKAQVERSAKNQNKPLAPDELDLLIYLTLKTIRTFTRVATRRYGSSNHPSIAAFKDEYREIVAVDEATDFTAMQLACMAMLANPRHGCVTLSGDLMQRMTSTGLQDWEEFEILASDIGISSVERTELTYSYRQSPRLLDLTKKLWQARTGKEPPYRSPFDASEHDPPPLVFEHDDLEATADWLAQRIVEIRKSYDEQGVIPTIAVFVPDEEQIDPVAEAIEDSLYLGQNINIERCKDGKVLGSHAKVRVFNVAHIKGLEFEAAFFVHLDQVAVRYPDLTDRMLYVGLSRASLYLGVTVEQAFPDVLAPFETSFEKVPWD